MSPLVKIPHVRRRLSLRRNPNRVTGSALAIKAELDRCRRHWAPPSLLGYPTVYTPTPFSHTHRRIEDGIGASTLIIYISHSKASDCLFFFIISLWFS
ncbi:hypothetical protein L1987_06690 [Smallanthus sonchifolius]|uniref:Uncharacterized protein n=1 Tax=Smallanthus sonchifolius TaxID=185202 RepID=A0ACB9JZ13_9ASTR|nr:hypothetical protein L1987_06690 [Smallanthus sonchifolius]